MRLLIRHQTVYRYEQGMTHAAMLLRLKPRNHDGQKVLEWSVSVNDQPITRFAPNGYGDLEALWVYHGFVDMVEIIASGLVETTDMAGMMSGMDDRVNRRVYLRDTGLTACNADIASLGDRAKGETVLARLHALSAAVRDAVAYRTGSTHAEITAAEALAQASGVCQDHAHIFISAARHIGVPSRYVTGYLRSAGDDNSRHETHAWAESWVDGLGWIGFDASNQVCVTDRYVRLASGMDAYDAAPVRGAVTAAGEIGIDADVRIAQASEDIEKLQQQQ